MPVRAERNPGDDADLVPPPLATAMDGCLSRRGPGGAILGVSSTSVIYMTD